jgi:hypothetical protein
VLCKKRTKNTKCRVDKQLRVMERQVTAVVVGTNRDLVSRSVSA